MHFPRQESNQCCCALEFPPPSCCDDAAEAAGELRARFSYCDTSVPRALSYALETAFSARPEAYRRGKDEAWARMGLVNCDEVQRVANRAAQ